MAAVAESIEESGRRIGHHAWIEMRLFETVGGWVASVPELEAKPVLAAQSHHHAWHAELWHGLLPSLPGVRTADLIAPADDAAQTLVDALAAPPGEGGTVDRLVGLYRVTLPALVATYTDHLDRTSPVADGPTIRALRLVLADEEDDRRAGDALLDALLTGPDERARADAREAELRALVGLGRSSG